MKIKRTLAFIMTAAMSFATLTGCSKTTTNYMEEVTNAAKWENASNDTNGSINIEGQGINYSLSFTSTGYKSNDLSYAEVKFNDPSGMFNLPEIKAYSDGSTAYLNKSYYEGIFTMSGQPVPEGLKNINAEYIAIDTGVNSEYVNAMIKEPDSIVKLSETVFGNTDLDLPYVQNGREYTMNLDSDQAVDLAVKGINAISGNLENINATFGLNLTSEQIAEVKKQMSNQEFADGVDKVKDVVKGSTISSKEVFEDDKYTQNLNLNIVVKDVAKVSVNVDSNMVKSEAKNITLPTSVAKFTAEEFNKLLTPEQQTVVNNANLVKAIA